MSTSLLIAVLWGWSTPAHASVAPECTGLPMPDDYDVFKVLTTERQQPGEEK